MVDGIAAYDESIGCYKVYQKPEYYNKIKN